MTLEYKIVANQRLRTAVFSLYKHTYSLKVLINCRIVIHFLNTLIEVEFLQISRLDQLLNNYFDIEMILNVTPAKKFYKNIFFLILIGWIKIIFYRLSSRT